MDQRSPAFRGTGEMYIRNLQTMIASTFTEPSFSVKVEAYFVSTDGASAAIRAVYTN